MFSSDNSIPQVSYVEIEQRIRIERSLAISAFVRDVLRTLARWLRVLASRSIWLVRGLAAERRRRRAISELQGFDDRVLADMGVTRGEIEFAVRNGRPRQLIRTVPVERRRKQPSSLKAAA